MASEYHHGEMDIQEQEATFAMFNGLTKWGSLAITSLLVWLVLWFCTPTGFLGATVTAFIVTVIGVVVLKEKPGADH